MAGFDWIKMRTDIYRHPKVSLIADYLIDPDSDLAQHVNQLYQRDMTVTRNVMRHAVSGILITVWGVMRHRGRRQRDDLVVDMATLDTIDDISDIPGFGDAMSRVGWVVESPQGIAFPRFFDGMNVEATTQKTSAAERQRRYRERKKSDVTVTSPVAQPVTSRNALEKNREEKKIKEPPPPLRPESAPPVPGSPPPLQEEEDFQELTQELVRLGVDQPGCLQTALQRGLSRSQIRDLLAYFATHARPNGWAPGALYQRLTTALPSLPVERGWPASKAPPPASVSPATDADAVRAWWEQLSDDEQAAICCSSATLGDLAQTLDWHPQRIRKQLPGNVLPLLTKLWRAAQDGTARPGSVPPQASPSAPQSSTTKAEQQAQKARENDAYRALEQEYGPALDALDRRSQLALAAEVGWQVEQRVREKGVEGRSARQPLLRQLQKIDEGGDVSLSHPEQQAPSAALDGHCTETAMPAAEAPRKVQENPHQSVWRNSANSTPTGQLR